MRLSLAIALLHGGCTTIGPCDDAAAREIVYDEDGAPAYAGQAIVIQSCGGGGYCHSEGIAAERRHGAPRGLEYDVSLASTSAELALDEVSRLDRSQLALVHTRTLAWEQIAAGRMPPGGVGAMILAGGPRYDHRVGVGFEPAARLDDEDGSRRDDARERVRNWLACRAPVIERTEPRADMDPTTIGAVEPATVRRCADVTWPSLYATIFGGRIVDLESGERRGGRCAYSGCHDGEETGVLPSFAVEPPAVSDEEGWREAIDGVARRLIGEVTASQICAPSAIPYVSTGAPEASLVYLKLLDDPPCGERMPLVGGALVEQRICALREWIACGACVVEEHCDPACLATARARCEVSDACVVEDALP